MNNKQQSFNDCFVMSEPLMYRTVK